MKTIIFLMVLMLSLACVNAATITFTMTNSVGQPDTNRIKLQPLASYAQADGSYQTAGLPFWIYPNTNGTVSTNLNQGNWLATNTFIVSQYAGPGNFGTSQGVIFTVPQGFGSYQFGSIAISGYNVFNYNGAQFSATASNIFAAMGYTPLTPAQSTNAAFGVTNGYTSIVLSNPSAFTTPAQVTNIVTSLSSSNNTSLAQVTNIVVTQIGYSNSALATTNFVNTQVQSATNGVAYTNQLPFYTPTNQFVAGTNNIATNQYALMISNSAVVVSNVNVLVAALNVSIATASNLLQNSKQPGSTWLTNIATTGAFTNQIVAGTAITLSTNVITGAITFSAQVQSTNGFVGPSITNGFETSSHAAATYYPTSNPSLFINNSALAPYLTSNVVYSAIQTSNANLATLSQVAASNAVAVTVASTTATNIALQVGLANSNLSYTIGLNETNNVVLASNRITSAYLLSIGNTNLATLQIVTNFTQSQIAASNVNFATRSQVSDTNTVNLTTTTNLVSAYGLAGTNFGYGIGLNATNLTLLTSNSIVTNLQAQIIGTNFNTLTIISNLIGNATNSVFISRSNGFGSRLTVTEWLSLGTKTNFLVTTNVIGIMGAGNPVDGTYIGGDFSYVNWTNSFNLVNTILLSGGSYYIQSNGVSLYSSADIKTWALVNGVAPAPSGAFGTRWNMNGVVLDGWITGTNLASPSSGGTTNFQLTGFVGGFTTNNQISTAGSNVVINLIAQYGVNPTNGISTNTALALINTATNSIWAGVTNRGAVQWGSTTNPLTSPRPATLFYYISNQIPQYGILTTN